MKAMWTEMNSRLEALEEENRQMARRIINSNHKTAKDRLEKKYVTFIIIEFLMLAYIFFFIFQNPFVVEKYRLITVIYWTLFFLLEIGIDSFLYFQLKNLDIYGSSVTEISKVARRNWKIHKIAIAIGIPIAIGAVILFALALDANEYTIFGMIFGAIIGLIIGLRQLFRFMKYYRNLQSEI